jgi:hypothetical protein
MKRDLLVMGSVTLAVGVVAWIFWGNPETMPRMHTGVKIKAAAELNLSAPPQPSRTR